MPAWRSRLEGCIPPVCAAGAARPNTALADVRTFILNEPEYVQERNSWQRAAAGGDFNFRRES